MKDMIGISSVGMDTLPQGELPTTVCHTKLEGGRERGPGKRGRARGEGRECEKEEVGAERGGREGGEGERR